MKNKKYSLIDNLILIDLGNVKPENIARLLRDNNLDHLDVDKLIELKGRGIDKIYLDKNTFCTIATVYAENPLKVNFVVDFMAQMLDMKGIKFAGSQPKPKQDKVELDLDVILDKINESGFDSLSNKEKEFLKNSN